MSIRRRRHNPLRAPRQAIDETLARNNNGTFRDLNIGQYKIAIMLTGSTTATTRPQVDEAFYSGSNP